MTRKNHIKETVDGWRKVIEERKETPLVVQCVWCDKTIVKGEERIIKEVGHFCSSVCWWNYDDCFNGEDF
jgi:hypothetical protein